MNFFLEAIIILAASLILIRVAGKKSVAQMTGVETITILAIGTTMGHAIHETTVWKTLLVLVTFVMLMIFVQYAQLKVNKVEKYAIGVATPVIINGEVLFEKLRRLRMTERQLEMRLREQGISYISDVKVATIEPNGQLGYELFEHAKPVTKDTLLQLLNNGQQQSPPKKEDNLFDKVLNNGR